GGRLPRQRPDPRRHHPSGEAAPLAGRARGSVRLLHVVAGCCFSHRSRSNASRPCGDQFLWAKMHRASSERTAREHTPNRPTAKEAAASSALLTHAPRLLTCHFCRGGIVI